MWPRKKPRLARAKAGLSAAQKACGETSERFGSRWRIGLRGGITRIKGKNDFFLIRGVDGDLTTIGEAAEQQLVSQGPTNRVLDQTLHRPGSHQGIKPF